MPQPARTAYLSALAGGAFPWIVVALLTGRTEAWDSPLYWWFAYPAAIVLAGVLGRRYPERPWRWALAMMLVQPMIMALSGSGLGLLPLGLLLFAVLALPAVVAAHLGARLSKRIRHA